MTTSFASLFIRDFRHHREVLSDEKDLNKLVYVADLDICYAKIKSDVRMLM